MAPHPDAPASTATVVYRAFAPGDMAALLAAFSASWTADELNESWLTTYVLREANFDPDGFIVAIVDDEVVGAAYAVAPLAPTAGVDPDGGWIPFLFVRTANRGVGIGRRLLELTNNFLSARGSQWSNVAAYAPGYLLPGVDLTNSPDSDKLFLNAGYLTVESPVSMSLDLTTWQRSADSLQQQADAEAYGFIFSPCHLDDVPELLEFAARVTDGDWGIVLQNSIDQHGDPERVALVREPGGAIVGFATFGSYEGNPERFGPFGVDPRQRGRSLGKILLQLTLAAMHSRGAQRAWFLWTDEHGPAGRLYTHAGFHVIRRFAVLQRAL